MSSALTNLGSQPTRSWQLPKMGAHFGARGSRPVKLPFRKLLRCSSNADELHFLVAMSECNESKWIVKDV
jgi:hypothetical protein